MKICSIWRTLFSLSQATVSGPAATQDERVPETRDGGALSFPEELQDWRQPPGGVGACLNDSITATVSKFPIKVELQLSDKAKCKFLPLVSWQRPLQPL